MEAVEAVEAAEELPDRPVMAGAVEEVAAEPEDHLVPVVEVAEEAAEVVVAELVRLFRQQGKLLPERAQQDC